MTYIMYFIPTYRINYTRGLNCIITVIFPFPLTDLTTEL